MSAWYILSALGFYQSAPGSNVFEIGIPQFDSATINLENGKKINIVVKKPGASGRYVAGMNINGKTYNKTWFNFEDIKDGADIEFILADKPNPERGIVPGSYPLSSVDDNSFVGAPYIKNLSNKFKDSIAIELASIDGSDIYFKNSAGMVTKYEKPMVLKNTGVVKFYAVKNDNKSAELNQPFYKLPDDRRAILLTPINSMYKEQGAETLTDGIFGTENWRSGGWISYYGADAVIVIDLLKKRNINYAAVSCLQDVNPWIVFPAAVEFLISDDNESFVQVQSVENKFSESEKGVFLQKLGSEINREARYLKIIIKSGGKLPAWHESAGEDSHLFIDEIIVEAD